jgi:hypothetical protein
VLPPKKKRNVSHDFFTSRRAKRDIDVYDDAGKESDAKRERSTLMTILERSQM